MEEHLFDGEKNPQVFRNRFKNLITSIKLGKRHSKIDPASVELLKEQQGKWADIHFSPR